MSIFTRRNAGLVPPLRSTAWRYERALEAAQGPRASRLRETDDEYVRVLTQLLTKLKLARGNVRDRAKVEEKTPDIFQAFEIHYSSNLESREILKAWLLTAATDEQIAERMGVRPKVVEYFESLVFCVRDRLPNRDWIAVAALKSPRPKGGIGNVSDEQRWWLYRLFGYFGGQLALEAMVIEIMPSSSSRCGPNVAGWFD